MGVHYHKEPILEPAGLLVDAGNKVSWPGSGSVIHDLIARNDGTFQNGVTIVDEGIEMDGVDDWVDFADGNFAAFERTDSFSVEFVCKKYTGSVFDWVCGRSGTNDSFRGWGILYRSSPLGALGVSFVNNTSSSRLVKQTTAQYNDSLTHHHVITYDGSSLASGVNIYTDGVLETSTSISHDNLTATMVASGAGARFAIGRRYNENANYMSGNLKRLVVYPNLELSSNQVADIFRKQKSRYGIQ